MKKYIKWYSLVLVLLVNTYLYSQHFISAKTFVKDGVVYLRYVPNDFFTLNACKEKGYLIKRIVWNNERIPEPSDFSSAKDLFSVNPYEKTNLDFEKLIKTKPEIGFLYNLLYEPQSNSEKNDMAFGLAMLSCDFDIELAQVAGLYYKDENLSNNKYAYLIQPIDSNFQRIIKPAVVIANRQINDHLENIDSIKIVSHKKEINLHWNIEQLKDDYTGYYIERSEDGQSFSLLNKKPHIQIQTQYENNKKDISYNDTTAEYEKSYYYRVRGLSFFGIYGNYSKILKYKLKKPLGIFPLVDSTHLLYDSILQIHWHSSNPLNLNDLKGFDIYRSKNVEDGYQKINEKLLSVDAQLFVDTHPNSSNYYKILAHGTFGDSVFSYPVMGLIPDLHPPKIPIGLTGKIDTSGNVVLHWFPNAEADLMGYRVFRENALNEEFVEVTKEILTDTIFRDTVTILTLSEDVFYSITAVDKVYNNSLYSPPIKLKRPDKIKPVEVQFKEVVHNDSSIIVRWLLSTSKDAQKYELWRKIGNTDIQKIKDWSAKDSVNEFIDTMLIYSNYYQYKIKVIDDDGNMSVTNSVRHYFDARIRTPIKKIDYKINMEDRTITLKWEYPEKDIYSFIIYKAKFGDPVKIIKTLGGNIFTFDDRDLYVGNQYEYYIKANFNSGAESGISKKIIVNY